MWTLVLKNIAIMFAGFISYWKWSGITSFKDDLKPKDSNGIRNWMWLRTIAFVLLILICFLDIFITKNKSSEIQEKNLEIQKKTREIYLAKMSTKLELEWRMEIHRKSQYDSIIDSNALDPSKLIRFIESFEDLSYDEKVRQITAFCLAKGKQFADSRVFSGEMSPKVGTTLEVWIENYEDTDDNGDKVQDKLDSKIGKFVKDSVSKWYNIYKIKSEEMDNEEDKKQHALKIIPQAIKHVYLIRIPQQFDTKMINEFNTQRQKYIDDEETRDSPEWHEDKQF